MYELALSREEIYAKAVAIEGHPDNVAAALYGGFALCPRPEHGGLPAPVRLEPPEGVEAIVVIPSEEVPTSEARAALPAEVPFADAVENVAAASQLALGIERSDLALIRRGLADTAPSASPRGALSALDGAGPPRDRDGRPWRDDLGRGPHGARLELLAGHGQGRRPRSKRRCAGWAEVLRVPFSPIGADVPEL